MYGEDDRTQACTVLFTNYIVQGIMRIWCTGRKTVHKPVLYCLLNVLQKRIWCTGKKTIQYRSLYYSVYNYIVQGIMRI